MRMYPFRANKFVYRSQHDCGRGRLLSYILPLHCYKSGETAAGHDRLCRNSDVPLCNFLHLCLGTPMYSATPSPSYSAHLPSQMLYTSALMIFSSSQMKASAAEIGSELQRIIRQVTEGVGIDPETVLTSEQCEALISAPSTADRTRTAVFGAFIACLYLSGENRTVARAREALLYITRQVVVFLEADEAYFQEGAR